MTTMQKRPRLLIIWHAAVLAEYQKPIAALGRQGKWDVHLLVPTAWPERAGQMVDLEKHEDADYTIHPARVLFPHHYYIYFFPSLLLQLIRVRPDVIYVYEEAHTLMAALVLLLRPLLSLLAGHRVGVVLYAAQNVVKRYPGPFRLFERFCFRAADGIVACGHLVAATLRHKVYRGPLTVVPLPSDPQVFRRDEAARATLRVELGIPDKAVAIGYAGKLAEEKGIGTLLDAFFMLPQSDGLHLLIAGGGPLDAALKGRVAAAGAEEHVHFSGPLPHETLVNWLGAGDVWVVPSETRANWREQFGRAAVEAMATENALVVSDSGELPAVVGAAGLVFPEGDREALAAILRRLVDDEPLRREMGRRGRERVLACFTPEAVAEDLSAVFGRVLWSSAECCVL